jgi:hypothetical protein
MTNTAWAQNMITFLREGKRIATIANPDYDFSLVTIGTSPINSGNVLITTGRDDKIYGPLFGMIIRAAGFSLDTFTYTWAHVGSVTLGRKS